MHNEWKGDPSGRLLLCAIPRRLTQFLFCPIIVAGAFHAGGCNSVEAVVGESVAIGGVATDHIGKLCDLANAAYAEIWNFIKKKKLPSITKKLPDKKDVDELPKFREMVAFLETEFFLGDPLKFSVNVVGVKFKFWQHVASIYAPEVPSSCVEQIAGAVFAGVYSHMRTCTKNPCECEKDDLDKILRFCKGVMCASAKEVVQ